MSITLIQVYEASQPVPETSTAFLFITNADAESRVEPAVLPSHTGFHAKFKLAVSNYADVHFHLADWLYNLDFSSDALKLAIFSDCTAVSATDAAFIAHLLIPEALLESGAGEQIGGFSISSRALLGRGISAHCASSGEVIHG